MRHDPYARALANLYSLARRGVKLELSRVREALVRLELPDQHYRIIHVAGTNGKGSVCAMLESCLRQSGQRTGLFTSPHLHRFVERISIQGQPLCDDAFVRSSERVLQLEKDSGLGLSFFECAFLIACDAFREAGCQWVVFETGLGGRLDATNVLTPAATVITNIALDHTAILGPTHEIIAGEKAGILKAEIPLVCGVQHAGAKQVIMKRAQELSLHATYLSNEDAFELLPPTEWTIALHGAHQRPNAALAVQTLRTLSDMGELVISEQAIHAGLEQVQWAGRIESVEGQPTWIFDAAHNPEGCRALADFLQTLPRRPKYLLFGAMLDKDYETMLEILRPLVEHVVLTRAEIERAAPTQAIACDEPVTRIDAPLEAMRWIEARCSKEDIAVACGSIFVMAEVRAARLGLQSDPAIRM